MNTFEGLKSAIYHGYNITWSKFKHVDEYLVFLMDMIIYNNKI